MGNKQKLIVLKRSSEFQALRELGQRVFLSKWLSVNVSKGATPSFRVGWTVSSKVGNAVTRNKIKRWCREYFRARLKESEVPVVDINVVFRPQDKEFYRKIDYNELTDCLDKVWRSASKVS